jgi:hypothetical protein
MGWTMTKLISTFRDLTGRKSTSQISDVDIIDYLNRYYRYVYPLEVVTPELKGWYTFDTVASTGSQDINDEVLDIKNPIYIDNDRATLWTDEDRFYQEYPLDYDTEAKPTDILLFDRTLIIRPIPDDAYEVRLRCHLMLDEISGDFPFVFPFSFDDSPYLGLWCPAVAYGSAILFLNQKGESDIGQELVPTYKYFLNLLERYEIRQYIPGRRPKGNF